MATVHLQIINANGEVLAQQSGENRADLLYRGVYAEGDRIVVTVPEENSHIIWQVDETLGAAMCYLKPKTFSYAIPFGDKMRVYSPKAFSGDRHYIYARLADVEEIRTYRNLAVNVADQHRVEGCYPHADANVETRGESVFEAKNAIDGVYANRGHGNWPYASWGINRDPQARMQLEFGRPVRINRIRICLRADFPHDSYWTSGTVNFSDGSVEVLNFSKTDKCQTFDIVPRTVEWLTFDELIKADDESPFPALTQIAVYGADI